MESTIAAQCFVEEETSLVLDMVGIKLLAGLVKMCKLTPFVIMEGGDIDYVGGGKMEMVYWADDEYFEFPNQQVKEDTQQGVNVLCLITEVKQSQAWLIHGWVTILPALLHDT